MSTIAEVKAAFARNFPTRDWTGLCQAVMYQTTAMLGTARVVYGSANAARLASAVQNLPINSIPTGWNVFFKLGTYGHVGGSLGNGYMYSGTANAVTEKWGNHLSVSSIAAYCKATGAVYLGAAPSNGKNSMPIITGSYGSPVLLKSQRVVLATEPANRRGDPSTKNPPISPRLEPGELGHFVGWVHGEMQPNGNDVWFKGISGNWFWSGGFTDTGTHDLEDLNPPAIRPTQRLTKVSANRRVEPTSKAALVGTSILPGVLTEVIGWVHGEAQPGGNDVWFKLADKEWSWSGSYADTGTHDLPDLNTVTPPPTVINRQVLAKASNHRPQPTRSATAIDPQLAPNSSVTVLGYAHGEAVSGNDVWYKLGQNDWAWSGSFTSQSIDGLPDLTSEVNVPAPITITTFGIDLSRYQIGIDYAAAKNEGVQFVIAKLGGFNLAPLYVDAAYAQHIDGARKIGMRVGHYYLTGKSSTASVVAQAQFFVDNLHNFDVAHDVLGLDNEYFSTASNSEAWDDTKVSQFFKAVIALTGIPASRLWHYASASYFCSQSWKETEALGVKVWWAAYGSNPTDRVPGQAPVLDGSVGDWWVHQFSSAQTVAGKTVDGNWSRSSLDALFATGTVIVPVPEQPPAPEMVEVPAQFVAEFKAIADSMETTRKLLD